MGLKSWLLGGIISYHGKLLSEISDALKNHSYMLENSVDSSSAGIKQFVKDHGCT